MDMGGSISARDAQRKEDLRLGNWMRQDIRKRRTETMTDKAFEIADSFEEWAYLHFCKRIGNIIIQRHRHFCKGESGKKVIGYDQEECTCRGKTAQANEPIGHRKNCPSFKPAAQNAKGR
jgi:hypothetical protein